MLHTNKIVFLLMVYKVVMNFIYCMFLTILTSYVKLSRFLKKACWMNVTRVSDKRDCILWWKGNVWCFFSSIFGSTNIHYIKIFHSLISFPTAFAFTSASTRKISSASTRKSGYPHDRNGWTTDKSMSVITLRSMGLVKAA